MKTGGARRDAFRAAFAPDRVLVVGGDGVDLDRFLSTPVEDWLA